MAKFLKSLKKFRSASISILDKKLDKNYLNSLSDFEIVFRSPGVPFNLPQIQSALKNGVKFSSVTKLFFEHCPAHIIGVTGTKGKGTTATLLYKILKESGFDAYLAGNIGVPAIEILPKLSKKSIVVLELSSFQLQDLNKSPSLAVIVDIFPDHLDSHKNFEEYLKAKSNISCHQKSSDAVLYFSDNRWSKKLAEKSPAVKIGINGNPFGLKKNFVMAAAAAKYLNCPWTTIAETIKKFKGLEHRMELIRKKNNVEFYNDSASTNPHTTKIAVESLTKHEKPIILIAGGKDKNLDYGPLAKIAEQSKNLKYIALFGENSLKIKNTLSKMERPESKIQICENLESAVKNAYEKALTFSDGNNRPIVLFSPGSASFDMFKNYQDRGKKFKEIVNSLKS